MRKALVFLLLLVGCSQEDQATDVIADMQVCEFIDFSDEGECNDDNYWEYLREKKYANASISSNTIALSSRANAVQRAKDLWEIGFVPSGRDVEPWPFSFPVEWDADPYEDRNWRYQLHAWRMIDPMLLAWEQSEDETFLQDALSVMVDWHAYHYVSGKSSDYEWYDMAAGLRAMKLAYLIDLVYQGELQVTDDDLKRLVHLVSTHAEYLMDVEQLSRGNHGLFQLHGLMALCNIAAAVRNCSGYQEYVEAELEDLLLRQFGQEGIHLENSPGYHFFVFNTVDRFLRSGWYDDFEFVSDLMQSASFNRNFMVHPDKTTVTVGDSEPKRMRLEFPEGRGACADEPLLPDCYFLSSFDDSGYVVVRSDWAVPSDQASMLFFMGMFHNAGHKLPDDMSFEWYEKGRRILTNAGKYSYNKDRFREFVMSTRAHNTIDVDGENFARRAVDAYGSALNGASRNGDVFSINASVRHDHLETTHERELKYVPGQWLAVIDKLDSGQSRNYTQWFHFSPEVEVVQEEGSIVATIDGKFDMFVEHDGDVDDILLVKGQEEPFLQGWVTASYGKMEERFSLGFSSQGDSALKITYFGFSEESIEEARRVVETSLNSSAISE